MFSPHTHKGAFRDDGGVHLMVLIILQHLPCVKSPTLFTLDVSNVICQLQLHKARKKYASFHSFEISGLGVHFTTCVMYLENILQCSFYNVHTCHSIGRIKVKYRGICSKVGSLWSKGFEATGVDEHEAQRDDHLSADHPVSSLGSVNSCLLGLKTARFK